MSKLKYILLGAILMAAIAYNPDKEVYYDQVLEDELSMGSKALPGLKYAFVEELYNYKNYYICGVLKKKKDDSSVYLGIFNNVFGI